MTIAACAPQGSCSLFALHRPKPSVGYLVLRVTSLALFGHTLQAANNTSQHSLKHGATRFHVLLLSMARSQSSSSGLIVCHIPMFRIAVLMFGVLAGLRPSASGFGQLCKTVRYARKRQAPGRKGTYNVHTPPQGRGMDVFRLRSRRRD